MHIPVVDTNVAEMAGDCDPGGHLSPNCKPDRE